MILEAAILNVKPGRAVAFEAAMAAARPLIAASAGFEGLEVRPCLEGPQPLPLAGVLDAARGPHRGLPRLRPLPGMEGRPA